MQAGGGKFAEEGEPTCSLLNKLRQAQGLLTTMPKHDHAFLSDAFLFLIGRSSRPNRLGFSASRLPPAFDAGNSQAATTVSYFDSMRFRDFGWRLVALTASCQGQSSFG